METRRQRPHQVVLPILAAAALALPALLPGLSPTRSQHAWVAGTGDPGNVDGPFMVARFNHPKGLLFDPSADRLVVADSGNQCLRLVDLARQNSTSTLRLTESPTGAAFTFSGPSALAWKQAGHLLYCLDPSKPGVAMVDLDAGTGRWLPLALTFSAKSGAGLQLSDATALHAVPGRFAVLSFGKSPALLFFDLPSGRSFVCGVSNSAGAIDDLGSSPAGLWAVSRDQRALAFLAPANAATGWLDGFPAAVTSTATCPDVLSNSMVATGMDHPWSFVQGAAGLALACDAPELMAYGDTLGHFQRWSMLDRHGRKIGLENDNIYDEQLKVLKTRSSLENSVGPRFLFGQPGYVAEDPGDQRWYLSETRANRIVSFSRSEPDDPSRAVSYDGIRDSMFPTTRCAGVRRVAVFSGCYFEGSKDTMRKMDTFTRRLQWYLNVDASLASAGSSYEVMFFGDHIPPESSLTAWIKSLMPKAVGGYQADEILIPIRPRDLSTIINAYQALAIDTDGLPRASFDPEYALAPRTWSDISGNPLYLDLVKYVFAHNDHLYSVKAGNAPHLLVYDGPEFWHQAVAHDFQNPEFMAKVFALYTHDLGVLKREMDAMAAARHRTVTVTLALYPESGTLGPQESDGDGSMGSLDLMRQSFRTLCKTLGFRYMDLVDELRVLSLDSPMLEVQDGHMTENGADLLGLVTAKRYLEPPQ